MDALLDLLHLFIIQKKPDTRILSFLFDNLVLLYHYDHCAPFTEAPFSEGRGGYFLIIGLWRCAADNRLMEMCHWMRSNFLSLID